jgi:Amt family ammonium transporter
MLRQLFSQFGTLTLCLALGLMAGVPATTWAQDETPAPETEAAAEETPAEEAPAEEEDPDPVGTLRGDANTLWTCIAAFLVFFMQAGFLFVEAGFCRAKNAVNLVMKNFSDFMIGTVTFWLVGFGLMFGATNSGLFGTTLFMYEADSAFNWAFLLFQTVFAATAATIVAGSMAERTKFGAYLVYSIAITAFIYPVSGSWGWGNLLLGAENHGWLGSMGFLDFAGSSIVHSVGGWSALAGAIVVGPRIGKFVDGKVMAIPGHNIPMAALGVFILWLGWFGFNPGSTTSVSGNFAQIAVNTNMSAAGGALAGMITTWIMFGKPDVSFTLNGALAGLVGITAGCDGVSVPGALAIGLISGVLVVFSCLLIEQCRIDDPVGASSVHGTCGVWGTLAVGLFNTSSGLFYTWDPSQLITQAIGCAAIFVWAFGTSFIVFMAIKFTLGLRVSEQEELEGLDVPEHGISAYPASQVVDPSMS